MSALDGAIVVTAVGLALVAAAAGRVGARAIAAVWAALLAGCIVQVWREGFYWQYAAIYALLAGLAVLAWRRRRPPPRRAFAWLGRSGVAGLAAAALLAWSVVPVPELPAPAGPYPVGSQVVRWVDRDREEVATADPHDHRNVVVQGKP